MYVVFRVGSNLQAIELTCLLLCSYSTIVSSSVQRVNPLQHPHDSRSVRDHPSACRVCWFYGLGLRSLHHFRGRGWATSILQTRPFLKSCHRSGLSGRHRKALVSYFTNGSGPGTNICPKVTYLFLTVSARNQPLCLWLTVHRSEPLFNSPGVHRKLIWFVFPTIRSLRFSYLGTAYLSNWKPEVRAIHSSAFAPLTRAPDVRIQLNSIGGLDANPFRCARYVRYEGAMTVIGINIVGLMMLLRCA